MMTKLAGVHPLQPQHQRTTWMHLMSTTVVSVFVLAATLSGCASTNPPVPQRASSQPPTFTSLTPVPGRWNWGNDGTSFEPCTSLTPDDLRILRVEPDTWTDISVKVGPGARGCRATSGTRTVAIQVINAPAVAVYDGHDLVAFPTNDGHYTFNRTPTCVLGVASGDAVVLASVTDQTMDSDAASDVPKPRRQVCDVVDRLVEMVMPKVPPAQPHPTYSFTRESPHISPYVHLMQAGRLSVPPGVTSEASVLDGEGRLLPDSRLDQLYPENSAAVESTMNAIAVGQLGFG